MAKNKRKRKKPGHSPPASRDDAAAIVATLEALAERLTGLDESSAGPVWGEVHQTLLKSRLASADAARVVGRRDVEALRRSVAALANADEGESKVELPDVEAPVADPDVPEETLRKAMRAFRKRLKLTRLDHESKLGVGPTTSGRAADVDAIVPPHEFDDAVWRTLAARGELQREGPGFYRLVDG